MKKGNFRWGSLNTMEERYIRINREFDFERSGWNLINEKWYYLDENYGRCTGWLVFNKDQENEMCYHLADDGVMVTGEQITRSKVLFFTIRIASEC